VDIPWDTISAGASAVATIIAAGISYKSWRTGEDSAKAAIDSAKAAEASARAAEALNQIEADRRHEEMAPQVEVAFRMRRNTNTNHIVRWAEITNHSPRDYRCIATIVNKTGSKSPGGQCTIGTGQTVTVELGIEGTPRPAALRLDFDAVDPCPCARPTASGRHWPRELEVGQFTLG
jgi:hypothetical protein